MALLILTVLILPTTYVLAKSKQKEIPPVDKIVILIEDYIQGVKTIRTEVINFKEHPTDVRECKRLAEDYDDFTGLDGIAICYYQGVRLTKYKL